MPMLCRCCHTHQVVPSRARARDYRCARCIDTTPAAVARIARYRATAKGRAKAARSNRKRIRVGDEYHSYVSSVETAEAINAHIRQRRQAFLTGGASATES